MLEHMSKLQKLDVPTLQEKVYAELRDALISGLFDPGDVLTIRKLAADFGTSPMPVREALHRLVSEHALEYVGRRVIRVPLVSPETMTDLMRTRMLIEGEAAALAAKWITNEEIALLRKINAGIETAGAKGQAKKVLESNREFHFTIYEAARSIALMRSIGPLWLQSGPYVSVSFKSFKSANAQVPSRIFSEHSQLISALAARDPEGARAALCKDLQTAATDYDQYLAGEHQSA